MRKLSRIVDIRKVELTGGIVLKGSNEEISIYRIVYLQNCRIVRVLKDSDDSVPVNKIWRKHGFIPAAYYKWKFRYGAGSTELRSSSLKPSAYIPGKFTYACRVFLQKMWLQNEAVCYAIVQ